MGTMTEIRETNRAATVALLGELGYDPNVVADRRGDGVLDWDEETGEFVLEIVEKDEDGKPVFERTDDGQDFKTDTVRVTVTPERLTEYRRALWSPA